MLKPTRFLSILLCCLFLVSSSIVLSDENAVTGRTILEKHHDAVITVKLVIKQGVSYGGRDTNKRESKTETTGTVIDPSGLTVISLFATDPTSLYSNMVSGGDEDMQLKFESEVSDVKLVMPDGTEIAAKIILRDKDLDLAYVRPTDKPGKAFKFADLTKASKPQILDEVFVVNRLGKVANRTNSISIDRIEAIVSKPRTFYIPGQNGQGGLGAPVFSANGQIIGVVLLRTIKSDGGSDIGSMLSSGLSGMGILPVILPAEVILEGAKQAPDIDPAPKEDKKE